MAAASAVSEGKQQYVRVHVTGTYSSSYEDLTPLAAEHLLRDLHTSIQRARQLQSAGMQRKFYE